MRMMTQLSRLAITAINGTPVTSLFHSTRILNTLFFQLIDVLTFEEKISLNTKFKTGLENIVCLKRCELIF